MRERGCLGGARQVEVSRSPNSCAQVEECMRHYLCSMVSLCPPKCVVLEQVDDKFLRICVHVRRRPAHGEGGAPRLRHAGRVQAFRATFSAWPIEWNVDVVQEVALSEIRRTSSSPVSEGRTRSSSGMTRCTALMSCALSTCSPGASRVLSGILRHPAATHSATEGPHCLGGTCPIELDAIMLLWWIAPTSSTSMRVGPSTGEGVTLSHERLDPMLAAQVVRSSCHQGVAVVVLVVLCYVAEVRIIGRSQPERVDELLQQRL